MAHQLYYTRRQLTVAEPVLTFAVRLALFSGRKAVAVSEASAIYEPFAPVCTVVVVVAEIFASAGSTIFLQLTFWG